MKTGNWEQDLNLQYFVVSLLFFIIMVAITMTPAQAQSATYPIGIVANGENYQKVPTTPYEINTNGVLGTAFIDSVEVNPPNSGSSLQLNVVLHVITTNGTEDFWLQNVLQIDDTKNANILDNIWNLSEPSNTSQICSHTYLLKYIICKYYHFYYKETNSFAYPIPFKETLAISEQTIPGMGVQIQFMYSSPSGSKTYDNKMIPIPDVKSASLLVTSNALIDNYLLYDAELVWGGIGNGEIGNFTSMDSTLGLYYYDDTVESTQSSSQPYLVNPWKPFPAYTTNGYDTAETAQNIYSTINPQNNGTALVEIGNPQNQNDETPSTTNESQTQPIINTSTYQQVYPPISISTDKQYYTNGDTITISGTLTPFIPGTILAIELLNPNNNVITVEQIVPQQSLYHAIIVTGNTFWHSGTYTIKAQYGSPNISVWTHIDLFSASPQITPRSTPASVPEFGTVASVVFLIGIITTITISTRLGSKMT